MITLDFYYLRQILTELHNDYPERDKVISHTSRFLGRLPRSEKNYTQLRRMAEQFAKVPAHEIRELIGQVQHYLNEIEKYTPESRYQYVVYEIFPRESGQDITELLACNESWEAVTHAESLEEEDKAREIQIRFEKRLQPNPYLA